MQVVALIRRTYPGQLVGARKRWNKALRPMECAPRFGARSRNSNESRMARWSGVRTASLCEAPSCSGGHRRICSTPPGHAQHVGFPFDAFQQWMRSLKQSNRGIEVPVALLMNQGVGIVMMTTSCSYQYPAPDCCLGAGILGMLGGVAFSAPPQWPRGASMNRRAKLAQIADCKWNPIGGDQ